MMRSRAFFTALQNGKFDDTLTALHPGVTTTWLGSLALWSTYLTNTPVKNDVEDKDFYTPAMLARVRLPIALVTGVLILLAGFCVYRLFGVPFAVLSIAFLAVEPFLLSESRRAHTDALAALFLFLSLLLWLCYLEITPARRRDLIFSGISFGLACLTKSHASAFILFIPLLLGWYIKQRKLSGYRLLWGALLWLMVTLLTIVVVFPYMWTRPQSLLICGVGCPLLVWSWRNVSRAELTQLTHTEFEVIWGLSLVIVGCTIVTVTPIFEMMFFAITHAHNVPKLFLGEIYQDPGWRYYPIVWGVWSGLLTLPLMVLAMYSTWHQRKMSDNKTFRITLVLAAFTLFYLLGLSIVEKKISRYLVIFLPAVSILTALGALHLAQRFTRKWIGYTLLVFVFVFQVVPVLRLHPYYRTYYHPLLSGKWVSENTTCITGAGIDLAADYLNTKPNAEKLHVRVTWFSKDFDNYFVGNALQRNSQNKTAPRSNFDYDIEYLRDKQVAGRIPMNAPENDFFDPGVKLSRAPEPEHVVNLNGIDYVWIYRILPPEGEPD